MIELNHVSKSFDDGETWALQDVSFTIQRGEILVILGSSGSGKTTLLRMLNRLEQPTEGDILLHGDNIQQHDLLTFRRSMGYVFQQVGLFPHLSILDNITIVLKLLKVPFQQRQQRAEQLLEFVNLDPAVYIDRIPEELSGGQQQRIGVARALANEPDVLLMDEPFGALDPINRDQLQQDLLALNQRLHKTIVFVTHDLFEALRIADRIAVMNKGQLQQLGSPSDVINHPANEYVRLLFSKPLEQIAQFQEHQAS